MKISLFVIHLIVGATAVAVTIYGGWQTYEVNIATQIDDIKQTLDSIIKADAKHRPPSFSFTTDEFDAHFPVRELREASTALSHDGGLTRAALESLYQFALTCRPEQVITSNAAGRKLFRWITQQCHPQRHPLSSAFFSNPPYMHPSGISYALLHMQAQKWPVPLTPGLTPYTHVSELKQVVAHQTATPLDQVIAHLTLDQLDMINYRGAIAQGPKVCLVATTDQQRLRYRAYETSAFHQLLDAHYLQASLHPVQQRSESLGNSFISVNAQKVDAARNLNFALLGGGALVLIAQGAIAAVFGTRRRIKERRRNQFMLQLLTHELRTPAAAMKLNLCHLQSSYDVLAPPAQKALLGILTAEAKLHNVLDASRSYLQLEGLKAHADICNDFEAYLRDVLGDSPLAYLPPKEPVSCEIDRRWLGFCIANVVSNALKHGVKPVAIAWHAKGDSLEVNISDQGQLQRRQFLAYRQAMRKGASSDGLGLGLYLVQQLLQEMGGQLSFKSNPTTFTLRMRRLHK